jgi:hypothetical protein
MFLVSLVFNLTVHALKQQSSSFVVIENSVVRREAAQVARSGRA